MLDVKLAAPKEMGGAGNSVNPEQLFATGYSTCFIGAMKFVAGTQKIALPADTSIDATIGTGQIPNGFCIEVQLTVHIPRMDRTQAQVLVEKAHEVCPYSNATRCNIEASINPIYIRCFKAYCFNSTQTSIILGLRLQNQSAIMFAVLGKIDTSFSNLSKGIPHE